MEDSSRYLYRSTLVQIPIARITIPVTCNNMNSDMYRSTLEDTIGQDDYIPITCNNMNSNTNRYLYWSLSLSYIYDLDHYPCKSPATTWTVTGTYPDPSWSWYLWPGSLYLWPATAWPCSDIDRYLNRTRYLWPGSLYLSPATAWPCSNRYLNRALLAQIPMARITVLVTCNNMTSDRYLYWSTLVQIHIARITTPVTCSNMNNDRYLQRATFVQIPAQ